VSTDCDARHVGRSDGVDDDHDADAWRTVGAHFTENAVHDVRFQLQEVLYDVAEKLSDGEQLTAADIDAIRGAKDELQELTEEHLARIATDCEPWDGGVGMMVPYGVMRRQLEGDDFPPERCKLQQKTDNSTAENVVPGTSGGGENHE
jgi:hypothetical protein